MGTRPKIKTIILYLAIAISYAGALYALIVVVKELRN